MLVGLAALVLLPGLASIPLVDPDEGRHAEIAREVLDAPSWGERLLPRLEGEPYRDKPILFYWVVAASYVALGPGPGAARLPSLLAGVGTVLATAAAGAHCFGSRAGLLAGTVLVTAPSLLLLARAATLDMQLTLWMTLGMLAGWRWAAGGSTGALLAAAVAAGLGTLTKGLVAPVLIGGSVLLWLAVERRLAIVRLRDLTLAALAFLAVTAPWVVAAGLRDPAYLHELVLTHHVQRFVGGGPGRLHPTSALIYVPALLLGFFPWSTLLPATAAATLRRAERGPDERFCVVWAGVVLVFFSLSSGKLPTYILPAFPPLALLTGLALDRILARPAAATAGAPVDLPGRLARPGLVVAGLAVAVAPLVLVPLARARYGGVLAEAAVWSAFLTPVGTASAWLSARWRFRPALGVLGAALVATSLGAPIVAGPAIGELTGTAHLARMIAARAPDASVVVYGLALPSLRFNLGRPVIHLDRPQALARFVAANPRTVVVTTPRHAATAAGAASLVTWHAGPRRVLLASMPAPDGVAATPPDATAAPRGRIGLPGEAGL